MVYHVISEDSSPWLIKLTMSSMGVKWCHSEHPSRLWKRRRKTKWMRKRIINEKIICKPPLEKFNSSWFSGTEGNPAAEMHRSHELGNDAVCDSRVWELSIRVSCRANGDKEWGLGSCKLLKALPRLARKSRCGVSRVKWSLRARPGRDPLKATAH